MSHFILRSAEAGSSSISSQQASLAEETCPPHHRYSTYSIRTTLSKSSSNGHPVFISTGTDKEMTKKIDKVEREKPKSSLLTTFKQRPHVKTVPKSVRWSEQITRIVDDTTYNLYKTYLQHLKMPDDSSKSTAVKAVSYICDADEISPSLTDMALKIFWKKHGRYPSGSELYEKICDANYDEMKLVLEFIQECETEGGIAAIQSLLDDLDDNDISETDECSSLQNCIRKTDVTGLQTCCKKPPLSTESPCHTITEKVRLRTNTYG